MQINRQNDLAHTNKYTHPYAVYVCLSVCSVSVCLYVCLSVCLSDYQSVCLSVSVWIYVHPCVIDEKSNMVCVRANAFSLVFEWCYYK